MMKRYPLFFIAGFIFAISSTQAFWPFGSDGENGDEKQSEVVINQEPLRRDSQMVTSFAPVVQKVNDSVVSIAVKRKVMVNYRQFNDPFFRFFFGDPRRNGQPQEREEGGVGSGVIISKDGYLLTNNHVIEGADEIKVIMHDGSGRELDGEIVGRDPATDIAVLKVEAKDLPTATLGDSDQIQVGDVVLAIGNPLDIGQTVTMGIVSAKGRQSGKGGQLSSVRYQDFIQTDASINPGNSGGALVDAEGRLIGINTAIASVSGGNIGIGFAVPVNMARNVMEQIIEKGKVTRGYLGVIIQPLNDALAEQFGLEKSEGALVTDVQAESAAEKAGVESGDIIVSVDGQAVDNPDRLSLMVSQKAPGSSVKIEVLRDGQKRELEVELGELPNQSPVALKDEEEDEEEEDHTFLTGVTVRPMPKPGEPGSGLYPPDMEGLLVISVDPQSNAYGGGLRKGDVIRAISKKSVTTPEEAEKILKKVKKNSVLLLIARLTEGRQVVSRYIVVKGDE